MLAILRAPAPAVSEATVAAGKAHVRSLLKSIRLATERPAEARVEISRRTNALCQPEESESRESEQSRRGRSRVAMPRPAAQQSRLCSEPRTSRGCTGLGLFP